MKKEWVKFAMVNIVVGTLVIQMPLSVRANEKNQEIKTLQKQNSENEINMSEEHIKEHLKNFEKVVDEEGNIQYKEKNESIYNRDGISKKYWEDGCVWNIYFDENGYVKTGWQQEKNTVSWYYFSPEYLFGYTDGIYEIKDKEGKKFKYYFDTEGQMQTCFWLFRENEGWRYFNKNGRMEIGLVDGYYFDENGIAMTGWQQIDGNWYYFDQDSLNMYNGGIYVISDKNGKKWRYCFGYDGKMKQNDWVQRAEDTGYNSWSYFDENGHMVFGWAQIGNPKEWYYFDKDGISVTGWQKINGKWYYFEEYVGGDGIMQTGWQKIAGKWYYMNKNGEMVTGWQKISGKWYYMNGNGEMVVGWQKISGKWYYMNGNGEMVVGWQKINGKWYYMNGNGAMVIGWQKISGKWYYMNKNGEMVTGWQKINGKWYYMSGNGVMATGQQKINGKAYSFDRSGVWIR